MATMAMIADVKTKIRNLDHAIQAIDDSFDEAVDNFSNEVRNQLLARCQDAVRRRDDLDASVRILETHLNSKAKKLLKLVKDKYKKAEAFLENSKHQLGLLTGWLNNLTHAIEHF
jgi:acyl-CoA reductase-like NAD-dependent aldehyde dehydrogenase